MMELLNQFFDTPIVSVLVGALITWFVSWHYYKRAGDELKNEAKQLQDKTDLVVYCLAHPDADVEAKYDEDGDIRGLYVRAECKISGSSNVKFESAQ